MQNVGEPAIYTWEIGNTLSLPHSRFWDPEIQKRRKERVYHSWFALYNWLYRSQ